MTEVSSPVVQGYQQLGNIPAYFAIAIAVILLSPVTILTLTPARWQVYTAYLIPYFSGSLIPTKPMTIKSLSTSSQNYGIPVIYLYANRIVLNGYAANYCIVYFISVRKSNFILFTLPFQQMYRVQCYRRKSGAPFTKTQLTFVES